MTNDVYMNIENKNVSQYSCDNEFRGHLGDFEHFESVVVVDSDVTFMTSTLIPTLTSLCGSLNYTPMTVQQSMLITSATVDL